MIWRFFLLLCLLLPAVSVAVETPRGYYSQLEFLSQGQRLSFGPFVGYYFRPENGADLTRLTFRCYNERQFYTDQLPADELLFEGEALLSSLPQVRALPRSEARIEPVFFAAAPPQWLQVRPAPQEEFVHFHSAYDFSGPSYTGYWLRHQPVRSFIYNMGGRVGEESLLYHQAVLDEPQRFPHIIEFDAGPTGR
ncbi:MAG: hypothetical protein C0619_11870 [Desulfuromonas sp.]|nr:MAG: hypothetical protein C0619_11870 [Desulfuromonas sp.]